MTASVDPGILAREHYAARIAAIERWLRTRGQVWTATDWELAGALALLARAIVAESIGPVDTPPSRRFRPSGLLRGRK